jgi:osmotically-inducible protein OsmY
VVTPEKVTDMGNVADQVKMAIERHPLYQDYDIQVKSMDEGFITLEGEVSCQYEMKQAADIAAEIPGVIEITNEIEVTDGICLPYAMTPDQPELPVIKRAVTKSDREIKEDIIYQYYWSPFVDKNQVMIDVEDGKATLTGTVNTILEMEKAVKNAYEGGAHQVDNQLKVDFWQI